MILVSRTTGHTVKTYLRRSFSTSRHNGSGKVAVIMGKPGGGKGTISKWMVNDFGFIHLSSGDMLRSHFQQGTDLGVQAKKYMSTGALVPDELVVDMVVSSVKNELEKSGAPVLLDGFPRTVPQAIALDEGIHVNHVFYLDVPAEEIVERISDRWVHPPSGRVYSYQFHPPRIEGKDDITGEDLIRRADDEPEHVMQRLQAYHEMTSPVSAYYRQKSVLRVFNGMEFPELVAKDRRSEAIYKSVKEVLENEFFNE